MIRSFWAGFVCGQIGQQVIDDGWGGSHKRIAPAIFYSRRAARQQYEDVRKVNISDANLALRPRRWKTR